MESMSAERILEERKIRRLHFIVDLTASILRQERMTLDEAYRLVEATKQSILTMFPDKLDAYNIIIKPRFDRIIREKFRFS